MNDAEHAELVEMEKQGRMLVGVDRPTARKFFTSVPISSIRAATGYAPYFEKSIVFLLFLIGPIALLGSSIASFFAFKWWGIGAVLICLLLYVLYHGMSSRGSAPSYLISFLLVVSVSAYVLDILSIPETTRFAAIFVFSLWCSRMLYVTSTSFYRSVALQSDRAFDFLSEGLELRRVE